MKNIYNEICEMKNLIRTGWKMNFEDNNIRLESDAEHICSMQMIADYVIEKKELNNLDKLKVHDMILYHEFGEIDAGDITPLDGVGDKDKHYQELLGVERIAKKYGMPKYLSLWQEFENRETDEAKFVYAMDKLDSILMAKYYSEKYNKPELYEEFFARNSVHCENYLDCFEIGENTNTI